MMKKWLVIYFKDGEVFGPIWEMEGRIKPTRWARQRLPEPACTYKIKEVEFFTGSYTDAFAKSDERVEVGE